MRLKCLGVIAVVGLSCFVTACQTDWEKYNIGTSEDLIAPEGLFAEGVTNREARKRSATVIVVDNFQTRPHTLEGNPAKVLRTLALFEWLANELRDDLQIPPYKIKKVLDARIDLRESVGMPEDTTTQVAINQLMAMHKFMKVAVTEDPNESEEIKQRRKLLSKIKSHAWNLLKGSAEVSQIMAAEAEPNAEMWQ